MSSVATPDGSHAAPTTASAANAAVSARKIEGPSDTGVHPAARILRAPRLSSRLQGRSAKLRNRPRHVPPGTRWATDDWCFRPTHNERPQRLPARRARRQVRRSPEGARAGIAGWLRGRCAAIAPDACARLCPALVPCECFTGTISVDAQFRGLLDHPFEVIELDHSRAQEHAHGAAATIGSFSRVRKTTCSLRAVSISARYTSRLSEIS